MHCSKQAAQAFFHQVHQTNKANGMVHIHYLKPGGDACSSLFPLVMWGLVPEKPPQKEITGKKGARHGMSTWENIIMHGETKMSTGCTSKCLWLLVRTQVELGDARVKNYVGTMDPLMLLSPSSLGCCEKCLTPRD